MKKEYLNLVLISAVCSLFFLCFSGQIFALIMSSDNYKIESDDFSISGGDWSSVNYIFRDTMGEVSTGRSSSSSYKLRAGYQEMLEVYISVSSPDNIELSPSISGITGGTGDGSVTWRVIIDGPAGFDMKIKASTIPAMKLDAGYYFSDYSPNSEGIPDYNWSVDSNQAEFGFTVGPETQEDTVQLFLDNTSNTCNQYGGSNTANKCWLNFNGTSYIDIINRSTRTDLSGEDEVVKFRAQSNGKFLKEGQYTATITTVVSSN